MSAEVAIYGEASMQSELPVIAGSGSTVIFVLSTFPMLAKAARTRDLSSYSLANIVLANVGNAMYAIYVFSLPPGPVWALHGFNMTAAGLMLFWYARHVGTVRRVAADRPETTLP
jgi:hypothetical protein